jgi:hypothetical protein
VSAREREREREETTPHVEAAGERHTNREGCWECPSGLSEVHERDSSEQRERSGKNTETTAIPTYHDELEEIFRAIERVFDIILGHGGDRDELL